MASLRVCMHIHQIPGSIIVCIANERKRFMLVEEKQADLVVKVSNCQLRLAESYP